MRKPIEDSYRVACLEKLILGKLSGSEVITKVEETTNNEVIVALLSIACKSSKGFDYKEIFDCLHVIPKHGDVYFPIKLKGKSQWRILIFDLETLNDVRKIIFLDYLKSSSGETKNVSAEKKHLRMFNVLLLDQICKTEVFSTCFAHPSELGISLLTSVLSERLRDTDKIKWFDRLTCLTYPNEQDSIEISHWLAEQLTFLLSLEELSEFAGERLEMIFKQFN